MTEIAVSFSCVVDLFDRNLWEDFLAAVEERLGTKLSHLDENDPIRKKVDNLQEAADYICSPRPKEEDRWMFGKFGKTRVSMMLHLHRDPSTWPNKISLYFPKKLLGEVDGLEKIVDIFKLGCDKLSPFYAYADFIEQIGTKRRKDRHAVCYEDELGGIFWLTFLNRKYMEFFGEDKIGMLPVYDLSDKGVVIRLADSPDSAEFAMTGIEAEELLGANSFVDPTSTRQKRVGEYVLSYEELLEG